MMDTHQEPRSRSREAYRGDPTKAGTKRLFSNRSRASDRESDHGENYDVEEEEQHSGKRQRASDWPLPTAKSGQSPRAPLRNRKPPNSPSYRRSSSSQVRPSRFLEGSMSDRISNKPPTTYIGDEESRDLFEQEEYGDARGRKMSRPKTFTHHSNTSIAGTTADKSESSRQSGIFRFGKSIAASFNPSNWKIFNKPQEEAEETAQQKILIERRQKAESMYQQLKKSGHFRDSTFHPSLFQQQEEKESVPAKHDSGVVLDDQQSRSHSRVSRISTETPREEKRKGRIFLDLPHMAYGSDSHFSQSPESAQESSRKQKAKFHFKKPSLSNMRKSISEVESIAPDSDDHHARRVPSRKDLQKQQKLVKRVSDLEGKLDAARRQLAEVLDEPVPSGPPPKVGRPRFVPGAMPSLPSERLLSGYCVPDGGLSESVSISQIGKAVTMDESVKSEDEMEDEQHTIEEPTRLPPPPLNFDRSLPLEPDTPSHDRPMRSVEDSAEESDEVEEHSIHTPVIQSVKSRKVQVITKVTAPSSQHSQHSSNSSSPSDIDIDSDYEVSKSAKHETSPSPSQVSAHEPNTAKTSPKKASQNKTSPNKASPNIKTVSKSKKRKSMKEEKTYKPSIPDTESDISSLQPRRAVTKPNTSNPPRKLQKISTPARIPSTRNHVSTPGKKVAMPSQLAKSKNPITNPKSERQSSSPPPSGEFVGVEHSRLPPQESIRSNGSGVDSMKGDGEPNMAAQGAYPSEDGEDVPPLPRMPSSVKLPSGEVVAIPAQSVVTGRKGSSQNRGSRVKRASSTKLSKARPSVSPRKEGSGIRGMLKREEFEWPEDVF